jgi:hypothetical protein
MSERTCSKPSSGRNGNHDQLPWLLSTNEMLLNDAEDLFEQRPAGSVHDVRSRTAAKKPSVPCR